MPEPLLLHRRLAGPPGRPSPSGSGEAEGSLLVLALAAAERQRLRGFFRSRCGHDLVLQLPRQGGALEPGEWLAGEDGIPRVRVEAAPEQLLQVRSDDPLVLLRAAYHLGNRHVALEVRPGELRLLDDPVLADLLRGLGVQLSQLQEPFQPEPGAYGGHVQAHAHVHAHSEAR